MRSKPTSSAVLATSASVVPIAASPHGQVKSGMCRPIFMNASKLDVHW
jgi:hypothetical protein